MKLKQIKPAKWETDKNGNKVLIPQICLITQPEKVKLFEENRVIDNSHVITMGKSVLTLKKVLRLIVIIKLNGEYYVADGQHLFRFMLQAGLPIHAFVIECGTINEAMNVVARMNSSSKNWSLKQFVITWSKLVDDYGEIVALQERYKFTYSVIGRILANNSATAVKSIKEGNFTITSSKKEVKQKIVALNDLYCNTDLYKNSYCTKGFIGFLSNIGIKEYLKYELDFFENVNNELETKNLKNKVFGRIDNYVDFFIECWNK